MLPIFPLQAGIGAFDPYLGPILLALLYAIATITSCFAPIVVQKLGMNLTVIISHLVTTVFVGVHLYPKWYCLLPLTRSPFTRHEFEELNLTFIFVSSSRITTD